MWLSNIAIENCRIIKHAELELSPQVNLVTGHNAQGKTSFLEALSVLSQGRSFRTRSISDVRKQDEDYLRVVATRKSPDQGDLRIGIERSKSETRIRINLQSVHAQSELSKQLPVTFIHPLSQDLILGGSANRRRFLDWLCFYLFDDFHLLWRRYQAVLKQRNAAFKSRRFYYSLPTLTRELSSMHPALVAYRKKALTILCESLAKLSPDFIDVFTPMLELKPLLPGIDESSVDEINEFYLSQLDREKKRGRTLYGLHLGELYIRHDGYLAATTASRGQIRLITILLLLAQSASIPGKSIIALDDISAELDPSHQQQLLGFLLSLDSQLFITSTAPLSVSSEYKPEMFHVKQGVFTQPA